MSLRFLDQNVQSEDHSDSTGVVVSDDGSKWHSENARTRSTVRAHEC